MFFRAGAVMRAFKVFVLTASAVALSGPAFAQMIIDPFPNAQAEAQVSPSAGVPGEIPEMPDQAALSPAAPTPVVRAPVVPDDAPPLSGSQYFKPVPVQEVYDSSAPTEPSAADGEMDEKVARTMDGVRSEILPSPDHAKGPSAGAAPEETFEERAGEAWSVRADESLHQALLRWSDAAGVEVIWDCRDDIPVLESLDAGGSYTQAVGTLLDQYEGREVRPVGQLHVDPQTRERILVVSLAESH